MANVGQEELKKMLVATDFKEETYENLTMQNLIILKNSAEKTKEQNITNKQTATFFSKREEFFMHMVLRKLQKTDVLYTLFAKATNLPYAVCDPESCNDQVWLFSEEHFAKKEALLQQQNKRELVVVKLENKQFLGFYLSLFQMGINELQIDRGVNTLCLELTSLVKQPDYDKLPVEKRPVVNPQLVLTAIYFAQERTLPDEVRDNETLKELEEEMLVNLKRGKVLVAVQMPEGQTEINPQEMKIPYLKMANGDAYQPIFSDPSEFQKFNREKKLRAIALDHDKLPKALNKDAKGVILNPASVKLAIPKQKL